MANLPLIRPSLLAVLFVGFLSVSITHAATIEFVATDLVDTTPGEDLWRYDYTVVGYTFSQSEFFDIYFDSLAFGTLTSGAAPNPDWDVLILQQPNPVNLPPFDTGIFDAFSLTNNASLTGAFSVTFIYLGAGVPGAQPFSIFDANSNLLESGMTTPPLGSIPEPSTGLLFLAATAVIARRAHCLYNAGAK